MSGKLTNITDKNNNNNGGGVLSYTLFTSHPPLAAAASAADDDPQAVTVDGDSSGETKQTTLTCAFEASENKSASSLKRLFAVDNNDDEHVACRKVGELLLQAAATAAATAAMVADVDMTPWSTDCVDVKCRRTTTGFGSGGGGRTLSKLMTSGASTSSDGQPPAGAATSRASTQGGGGGAENVGRWDLLWRDSRLPDIEYEFQHYAGDVRKYMDQYRKCYTYVGLKLKDDPSTSTTTTSTNLDVKGYSPATAAAMTSTSTQRSNLRHPLRIHCRGVEVNGSPISTRQYRLSPPGATATATTMCGSRATNALTAAHEDRTRPQPVVRPTLPTKIFSESALFGTVDNPTSDRVHFDIRITVHPRRDDVAAQVRDFSSPSDTTSGSKNDINSSLLFVKNPRQHWNALTTTSDEKPPPPLYRSLHERHSSFQERCSVAISQDSLQPASAVTMMDCFGGGCARDSEYRSVGVSQGGGGGGGGGGGRNNLMPIFWPVTSASSSSSLQPPPPSPPAVSVCRIQPSVLPYDHVLPRVFNSLNAVSTMALHNSSNSAAAGMMICNNNSSCYNNNNNNNNCNNNNGAGTKCVKKSSGGGEKKTVPM